MGESSAFLERLAALLLALGPALPIAAILLGLGRRTLPAGTPPLALTVGAFAALSSLATVLLRPAFDTIESPLLKAAATAFLGAALPEEIAKLLVLATIVLRENTAVTSRDAILAGAWVGLGFALLENVFYVADDGRWLLVATLRAGTAVPGHVAEGLIMGWLVQRARGSPYRWATALLGPVLLHGFYDWPVMAVRDSAFKQGVGFFACWAFFIGVLLVLWHLLEKQVSERLRDLASWPRSPFAITPEMEGYAVRAAAAAAWILRAVGGIVLLGSCLAAWFEPASLVALPMGVLPLAFAHLWRGSRSGVLMQEPAKMASAAGALTSPTDDCAREHPDAPDSHRPSP